MFFHNTKTNKYLSLHNFLIKICTFVEIHNPNLNKLNKTMLACQETPFIVLQFEKTIVPWVQCYAHKKVKGYNNNLEIRVVKYSLQELGKLFTMQFQNFKILNMEHLHTNCKLEKEMIGLFLKKQNQKIKVCKCIL